MSPKIIRTATVLLFAFISGTSLYAQTDSTKTDTSRVFTVNADEYKQYLPNYSPTSPNAAAFQKFGDYQVNLSNGLPSISIPLYEVQVGNLSLPIVLNYHAGGHPITELASWVGWGWNLDYGGMINRTVNGLADDINVSSYDRYIDTPIITRNTCSVTTDHNFVQNVIGTTLGSSADVLPDLFTYSIPGYSGKFQLGQNGASPLIIPWEPVSIDYALGASTAIDRFEIVSPQGTSYIFGKASDNSLAADTTFGHTSGGSFNYSSISSWKLREVNSVNTNDYIKLDYQSDGQTSQNTLTSSISVTDEQGSFSVNLNQGYVSRTVKAQNIHTITYPNGEVEFIQNSGSDPGRADITTSHYLKEIKIYHYLGSTKTLLKTFSFEYSYFKDRLNLDGRLKLDQLLEISADQSDTLVHSFDYFTDSYSWVFRANSSNSENDQLKQDYNGYYNGQNNSSFITASSVQSNQGNGTITLSQGGANRNTNTSYLKEGILKRITYPTKGYTDFDFDYHRYKDDNGSTYYVGGLRLKSIESFSKDGTPSSFKRYEYESTDGADVGILTNQWSRSSFNQHSLSGYKAVPASGIPYHANTLIFSGGATLQMGSIDGSTVHYPKVTEYFEESSSPLQNGKNVYEYSSYQDLVAFLNTYPINDMRPWLRGNLLSKKTYDSNNQLVASSTHTYSQLNNESRTNGAFVLSLNSGLQTSTCSSGKLDGYVGVSGYFPEYSYTNYSNKTGASKMVETIVLNDSVSTTSLFSYDTNLFPDTTTTVFNYSSKERQMVSIYPTHNTYASDAVADSMISRNMTGIPLEQIESESFGGSPSNFFRRKNVYGFVTGANARGLSNNILPKETWVDLIGDGLEKRVDFISYDTDGNLLEYMVDSVSTALAYGYNNELLIGKAENTTRSALSSALSFAGVSEADFETTSLSNTQLNDLSTIRTSLGNTRPLTWYSHIPHVGISGIVSPKGIIQSFEYDDFQRLKQINDDDGNIDSYYQYHYADTIPSGCDIDPPVLIATQTDTCFVSIEASGCSGTVNWNTGATGNSLQVTTGSVNSYSATCSEGSCTSASSNTLTLPELYQGWNIAEIGSPPIEGCVYHNDGTITLSSSGSGPTGSSDQFNYVYKSMTADSMVFLAKLESITSSPNEGMRSGLMIRTSTSANAAYYEIIYDEANEALGLLGRSSNGGTATFLGFNFDTVPLWLRIKKRGDEISTWVSSNTNPSWSDDGQWVQIGTTQTNTIFNTGFLYGLDAYNGNYSTNSLINTSTFSNISIHTF